MNQGSRPTNDDRAKVIATLINQLKMILPPNQTNEAPQLAKKAEETVFNAAQTREDYLQRWEKKFHLLKNKATEMRGTGGGPPGPTPQAQPTQVPRQPTQAPHMSIPHPQINIPPQFNQGAFGPRPGYQQPTNPILPRNPAPMAYPASGLPVAAAEDPKYKAKLEEMKQKYLQPLSVMISKVSTALVRPECKDQKELTEVKQHLCALYSLLQGKSTSVPKTVELLDAAEKRIKAWFTQWSTRGKQPAPTNPAITSNPTQPPVVPGTIKLDPGSTNSQSNQVGASRRSLTQAAVGIKTEPPAQPPTFPAIVKTQQTQAMPKPGQPGQPIQPITITQSVSKPTASLQATVTSHASTNTSATNRTSVRPTQPPPQPPTAAVPVQPENKKIGVQQTLASFVDKISDPSQRTAAPIQQILNIFQNGKQGEGSELSSTPSNKSPTLGNKDVNDLWWDESIKSIKSSRKRSFELLDQETDSTEDNHSPKRPKFNHVHCESSEASDSEPINQHIFEIENIFNELLLKDENATSRMVYLQPNESTLLADPYLPYLPDCKSIKIEMDTIDISFITTPPTLENQINFYKKARTSKSVIEKEIEPFINSKFKITFSGNYETHELLVCEMLEKSIPELLLKIPFNYPESPLEYELGDQYNDVAYLKSIKKSFEQLNLSSEPLTISRCLENFYCSASAT